MATTLIPPRRLAELHARGRAEAARAPFVDPDAVAAGMRVLGQRGEEWAVSVLGRPLTRRSRAHHSIPFFYDGDFEILVLADTEETDILLSRAT
ncbi:hypothetical protein [Bailinhaonella thermotolerans]|uniref:Uncharacterized protein n=1 Tax=Bailinhaonella thermotolerans TaxID=1070861 RepID=A0A3A4AGZ1_9ACTN|nr:hypothetical protein [Bailinhaonella thermotolerans]RJL19720.1 hypothetical protein D5H75_40045 [Bailinhaonella thermotolerans]